jgi:hypothetical protein
MTSSREAGYRRVEMAVIHNDPEAIRIAVRRVDRDGFVSALEDMASPQPPPVPAVTETPEQQFHACG